MGVSALLDTHALLWAVLEPHKLSVRARTLIGDPANDLLVSSASAWEIATKHRLGKLNDAGEVVRQYNTVLIRLRARELPISSAHALYAGGLVVNHRDPFDRLLAAQAELEGVPLVTADHIFGEFQGVTVLW